jgi:hypothetical protein
MPDGFSLVAPRERNDCTVRAISTVAGVDYATAHAVLKVHGRRTRCAFHLERHVQEITKTFGLRATFMCGSGTLGKFLQGNPAGTFLIRKHKHAFAIIDGVVHDYQPASDLYRIKQAWRIEKETTHA